MLTLRNGTVLALLAALLALARPPVAAAAEIRPGESVIVGPTETIDDDLYAFGQTVTVLGRVNGSVFAAGSTVSVGGTVAGDVFAAGSSVSVTGDVRGSVRAAGSTVGVSAPLGRDLLAAGGVVGVADTAKIGRDVLAAGGTIHLAGPVARNVRAAGGGLTVAAPVGGAVDADVERLSVTDAATIGGTLRYTARGEARVAPGARVAGDVVRIEPPPSVRAPSQPGPLDGVVGWLRGLTGAAVLGLLLVLMFPTVASRAAATIAGSPWSSVGLGFGEIVGGPVLALVVFLLGLILGGWWLGLAVLAVYGGLLSVGYAVAAFALGGWLLTRTGQDHWYRAWALLLGVVALAAISLVPVLGPLTLAGAALLGTGGLSLAAARAYRGGHPPTGAVAPEGAVPLVTLGATPRSGELADRPQQAA